MAGRLSLRLLASLALSTLICAVPTPLNQRASPIEPSEDPFYAVPQAGLDEALPGAILRHREPPAPIVALGLLPANLKETHQILYKTTDSHDKATATVVTVLIPHNADLSKVLSYQAAEDASYLNCAPSYALQLNSKTGGPLGTALTQIEAVLMEAALAQGWVVIVPDHQGPSAAFLANKLAGQIVLDGIRAAINSGEFTGIAKKPTVAMWGYSGGSIVTGWAAEIQQSHAPELAIGGAILGGTVPNIAAVVSSSNKGQFSGLIPAGVLGLSHQYPELVTFLDQNLLPEYKQAWAKVEKQCLVSDASEFLFQDVLNQFRDKDVLNNPVIKKLTDENNLGHAVPAIPMYFYNSIQDEITPIGETDKLFDYYCNNGASVLYHRDVISEHITLQALGAPTALSWVKDIMDTKKPQKGCVKKNVLSSLLDPSSLQILPVIIINGLLDLLGSPIGPGGFFSG